MCDDRSNLCDDQAQSRVAESRSQLDRMLFEFARLFDYQEPNERAIALVGAAFLDDLLTQTIRSFLIDDPKEVATLIGSNGQLATFSAKSNVCYCLGLFNRTILHDLRLIGRIRNRFAHDLVASFDDPTISKWCCSLKWHRFSMFHEPPPDATSRDHFQVGVNQLVSHLIALPSLSLGIRRQAAPDF